MLAILKILVSQETLKKQVQILKTRIRNREASYSTLGRNIAFEFMMVLSFKFCIKKDGY